MLKRKTLRMIKEVIEKMQEMIGVAKVRNSIQCSTGRILTKIIKSLTNMKEVCLQKNPRTNLPASLILVTANKQTNLREETATTNITMATTSLTTEDIRGMIRTLDSGMEVTR